MYKHKSPFIILICITLLSSCLSGCSNIKKDPLSTTIFSLNTVITITLYDTQDESILAGCTSLCSKYEKIFSRTSPESELYKLNHGLLADDDGISTISDELSWLISYALTFCQETNGAFDITIAPLSDLWNFSSDSPKVPSEAQISEALSLIDYKSIHLDENRISFTNPHTQIDLGAIAKGYISDKIKEYLLSENVKSALIDLGGNVLCVGKKPDGTPFSIGIQKPFANRNETLDTVSITDQSVISSGTYERCFEENDVLYHHLLSPFTGYPCDNGLTSVTIISTSGVLGDALSTSCFMIGLDAGMALVESLDQVEAIFITQDNTLHYSTGLCSPCS